MSSVERCPTCGHWWAARPRWYAVWLWPVYWTRCPFLDFFYGHQEVGHERG
jgi:hypothetical protein